MFYFGVGEVGRSRRHLILDFWSLFLLCVPTDWTIVSHLIQKCRNRVVSRTCDPLFSSFLLNTTVLLQLIVERIPFLLLWTRAHRPDWINTISDNWKSILWLSSPGRWFFNKRGPESKSRSGWSLFKMHCIFLLWTFMSIRICLFSPFLNLNRVFYCLIKEFLICDNLGPYTWLFVST